MKLLYLTGTEAAVDAVTTQQLSRVAPQLSVTTVATAAEALVEIRRMGGFHALLTSPTLARNETLAIITSLRTDRVPIAIVPVVGETQQDFLASAIGAGADDVLVLRGDTLVQPTETLTRIRQSPHLFPSDDRRLRVLYAGSDPVVWDLLEQLPFVRAEQATCTVDGGCPVRMPGSADGGLRCDVVLVDEKPNEAHPLQVIKSIKAQASDLPVIVLSPSGAADVSTAAFDLGADDAVLKTSAYRRRLVATLRRVHQRLELTAMHATLREREARLRQIVETMPEGLTVISGDGTVLAMNAAGLMLVGATRPREVVGRDFVQLVTPDARADVRRVLEDITAGVAGTVAFDIEGVDRVLRRLELRGVRLERDARGGRGVIGILRTPGATPAGEDEGVSPDTFERERALESALSQAEARLRELDEELRASEQRHRDRESEIDADRRRSEAERASLEARVREAEAAAGAMADLERALAAAKAELERAGEDRAGERDAWDQARMALEARLQEQSALLEQTQAGLDAEAAALETRLAEVVSAREADRLRHEVATRELEAGHADRQARERAEWDEERRTLENRLSELRVAFDSARHELEARRQDTRSSDAARADLEAALEQARRELASLTNEHAQARSEWDEARAYLESRCAELVASATSARDARGELEATLEAAQGLLRQTAADHKADRARWDEERRELDARLIQLSEAAHGREALEAASQAIRAELQQAVERHQAERAEWDAERHALDEERATWEAERRELGARLRDVSQTAEGRHALEAAVQAIRTDLQQATERHQADRATWETERAAWDTERAAWHTERAAWSTERGKWEEERRDLAARVEDGQTAAHGRQHLEEALASARADCDRALAELQSERSRLESLRAEIDRNEGAHAAERDVWDRKRRELESQLADVEAISATRANLETALHVVRAELAQVNAAFAEERAGWDRAREAAEHSHRQADTARVALERRLEAAERQIDERREQVEALEHERQHLQADRARLDEMLSDVRAAQAELLQARTTAIAERDEARGQRDEVRDELDQVRRALDQERTRRSLLEAAVREARKDAESRLAAVEAEFASTRRALESELADAAARLERLTEESAVARQRLEEALAGASAGYERLLGSRLIGHAVMTPDGLLVRCNDTFAQLFGYLNARDALARTAGRPFPGLSGRAWLDAKLEAERRIDQVESTLDRLDGRAIRVVESAQLIDEPGGRTVVERLLIDRTGSRAHDDRLRQADRLEEVGTLVAAMAPDIESLVASVAASGSELAGSLPPSDARREHTTRIVAHAAQAGDLIRQLVNFSLKQVRPAEPVDLADAIRRSEKLLRPLLGPHVGLKHQLGRSETVTIAQDDLDRLLSALVVAARDLLPIGGTVIIETARVDVSEADADPSAGLRPGAHLLLAVTASGYGVQPAQRSSALDAVANRCGGHVRVAGEPGRSASFRVYFTRWPGLAGPMA